MALPDSNADIVAVNVVYRAIVGEVNSPGESVAALLLKMAAIAHDIGGDCRAASKDWRETMADATGASEAEQVVDRVAIAMGDTWAKEWMLTHLAKHLHCELERRCLEDPAAPAIASIEYDDDGRVKSWRMRTNSSK